MESLNQKLSLSIKGVLIFVLDALILVITEITKSQFMHLFYHWLLYLYLMEFGINVFLDFIHL